MKDVLEGQTQIPVLGRPPRPSFNPDGPAPDFRAKEQRRKLPFTLPGPLSMMLGGEGAEQLGAVVGAVVDYAGEVLALLKEIAQEQLSTQRELVRVQVMLSDPRNASVTGRETSVLLALARDDDAWEREA